MGGLDAVFAVTGLFLTAVGVWFTWFDGHRTRALVRRDADTPLNRTDGTGTA